MTLRLKNTLSGALETFEPLVAGTVRMYVCGPTVYDYFHIGNARPFIVFDVIRRYLEHKGLEVTFVQNITDIDDRIIKAAREQKRDSNEIAEEFAKAYLDDLAELGVKPATHAPRATQTIPQIIALIRKLDDKGYTYAVDGDVFYRVNKFKGYGKLSKKTLDKNEVGASERTTNAIDSKKEHPFDFALWKAQKAPDEPAWESPWGLGRPGWHIECSAMSASLLGETFDIHAGGEDLTFPHHENEIAQSEAAHGKPFVKYWLHNGFINIAKEATPLSDEQKKLVARLEAAVASKDNKQRQAALDELEAGNVYVQVNDDGTLTFKGSKSLGNIPYARDVFERGYTGQVVRLFMMKAHYRGPITFSWKLLDEAKAGIERWRTFRRRLASALDTARDREKGRMSVTGDPLLGDISAAREAFETAMDADFNTPAAVAAAFDLIGKLNGAIARLDAANTAATPAASTQSGAKATKKAATAKKAVGSAENADTDDRQVDGPVVTAAALKQAIDAFEMFEAVLGLDPALTTEEASLAPDLQALVDARAAARANREWAESDRLRDELAAAGILVQDGKDGQKWHRKT